MKKLNRFLYLLAFLKFLLPFLLQHPVYEPHRDEFLYLAEGAHPAFGFMEVPPMLSIFSWLTLQLGHHLFWIKCWPSLIGAINLMLIGKLVLSFGGKYFALLLIFCCFFFSGFLRVQFLFQPNFLEVFFYSLITFGLIRYIQTTKNKWLYVAGIAAGLGLLSKYSVGFYLIALIPALFFSEQRNIFRNRHLYFAAGVALIIFLPNAIWQYVHHFPVVYHMEELSSTQLQYIPASQFMQDQFLMFLPVCFIWVAGFFYLLLNHKFRQYIFICWAYVGVIALLLYFHGKSYYALGLYPVLFGFGSLAIETWTQKTRYFLRYVLTICIFLSGAFFCFIMLPILPPESLSAFYRSIHAEGKGILRWEDQKDHALPQDFADMLGWEEMTIKAAEAFHSLSPGQQANTIIFCDNYGMAGAVNYYRQKYGLSEAYSDNASFLYWLPDSLHYDNIVLITDDRDEMQHHFVKEFNEAKQWGLVSSPYAREKGDLIILLMGANNSFRKDFNDKIRADKLKTRIIY